MIRRLIVPLGCAALVLQAGPVLAQAAFPAPLPGQADVPAANGGAPPASPGGGVAPSNRASDACAQEYTPLRDEAEKQRKLISASRDRKAPPVEICRLIENYGQAEIKIIKYVEANAAKCGFTPQLGEQLKANHERTNDLRTRVCTIAQEASRRLPAGPVGDFPPHYGRP